MGHLPLPFRLLTQGAALSQGIAHISGFNRIFRACQQSADHWDTMVIVCGEHQLCWGVNLKWHLWRAADCQGRI